MANKTANVIARVEPDIKEKAEAILQRIGVPVSVLINALYYQIIYENGVPFSIKIPKGIEPTYNMSDKEFDEMLDRSYNQAKNGESIPVDEAFDSIKKELNLK